MATVTVNSTSEGGFISNLSGLYPAASENLYISKTSSSSDSNMCEAHMFFDTTDANTGLSPGDTLVSATCTIHVTAYNNGGSCSWVSSWGNGAGTTFDIGDFGVDNSNQVFFDPAGVGSYAFALGGVPLKVNNFHVKVNCQSNGSIPPDGEMQWDYTTRPFLTLTYTPAPVVSVGRGVFPSSFPTAIRRINSIVEY